MLKIIRYDRRQMKLRSNTHGCELIKIILIISVFLHVQFNLYFDIKEKYSVQYDITETKQDYPSNISIYLFLKNFSVNSSRPRSIHLVIISHL